MNKKILALLLAFAMIFSTMTTAFANETATIGAEAESLKLMGVLQGDDGGVTAEYLAKETTRMQAAIMYLRLKGLEDEAMAFTGTTNFADAGTMKWAEGKAIMAYLKANPQLGWIGTDGGNFMPFETITVQQYYKVILEALGYKQTTPEIVGDFAWSEVTTFAASKGLVKLAGNTAFTNNDLAIATIEGLKTNMKDGGNTLAVTLVNAGMINKDAAIAAGLYAETTTAVVKAVKAIGNSKVEVEFDSAVAKAYAENAANYSVVEKGTTTALEVKAAVLDGTTKVVVETAAQTAGKAYTMTVGTKAINFGGVAKNSSAATLDSVKGTDTNKVELTFDKILDLSVLDKAHYSIEGVTVLSAAWADSTRKVVELTTEGMQSSKTYKVVASDIKTVDLVNLKSASKYFMAKSDKTAPTASINKATSTNTRVIVYFNEEVTKESAEDLANYSITVGSTTNELEITAAKLVEDRNDLNGNNDDEDMAVVELTTASQKTGTKYVLHVNNVADISVLSNKITKEQKLDYYGIRVDDVKPTVTSIDYLTNKLIKVVFNESSRLDAATALDINNYSVNNDIAVEKAEFENSDNPDSKVVRLTVSELGDKSSYQITVNNVADEYGNVMNEKKFSKTFSKTTINTPATVSKVEALSDTSIKVSFTKEVETITAKDVANYSINNEIGTPVKATVADDSKSVTLTVGTLKANTEYKVTINGVKDLAGNTIVSTVAKFVASATANDTDAPEIEDIVAVNDRVIRVSFNEAINVAAVPTIDIDITGDGLSDATAAYKVSSDDDDIILEFRLADVDKFTADADVQLVSTTAKDLAGNVCADENVEFASVTDVPEKPELVSWEQTSVKQFKLIYSEKIDKAVNGTTITDTASTVVPYALTVNVDKDDNTIVYLTTNQIMDADKVFELNLASILANYHSIEVAQDDNSRTVLETGLEDEEAPFIESVAAVDKNTVEITYSEDLSYEGRYTITYDKDDDGGVDNVSISGNPVIDADDNNVVKLNLTTALDARFVYTLKIATQAKDVASNRVDKDAEFEFAGTNVAPIGNYITGVKVLNGTTIKVNTFSSIDPDDVAIAVYDKSNNELATTFAPTTGDKVSAFTVAAKVNAGTSLPEYAFVDGENYTVKINAKVGGATLYSYTFKGIVEAGITVETVGTDCEITFSDAAANDEIQILTAGGFVTATVGADGIATVPVASLGGDTVVDIMAVRNNVVLFYDLDVEL